MGFLDKFLGKKKDKYFLELGGDESAPAKSEPAVKADLPAAAKVAANSVVSTQKNPKADKGAAERQAKQDARASAKQAKDAQQAAAAAQKAATEAAQKVAAEAAAAAEAEAISKMGFADIMQAPMATMRTRRPGPSLDKFKGMIKEMKK